MAIEYKYNPYSPQYITKDPYQTAQTDTEKTISSLEAQQKNLEKRLKEIGGGPDNRNFLEKLFNLPEGQNAIMDIVEVVNKPLEAVKGFVSGLVDDDAETSPFGEALKGLTGERRFTSFTDTILLHNQNINEDNISGLGKFALDFAGDILLDPLTYVPAGVFASGVKKVLKLGTKKVKIVDAVLDGVNNAGKIIAQSKVKVAGEFTEEALQAKARVLTREAFEEKIKAANKEVAKQLEDLAKGKKLRGAQAEIETNVHLQQVLQDTAKELGLNPDDFFVINEGAQVIQGTTRKVKDAAIYYAVPDTDDVVRLTRGETKKIMRASGAYGTNTKLDLKDIQDVLLGRPMPDNPTLGRQFLEGVKDVEIRFKGQKPRRLVEYLQESITKQKGDLLDIINNKSLYNTIQDGRKYIFNEEAYEAVGETVKRLFFDDLAKSGVGHISIRTNFGKIITLSTESAKRYVSFTAGVGSRATGIGVRASKGFKSFFTKLGMSSSIVTKKGKKLLKVGTNAVDIKDVRNIADGLIGNTFKEGGLETALKKYSIAEDGSILFEYGTKDLQKKSLVSNITLRDPDTKKLLEGVDLTKIDESDLIAKDLVRQQAPQFEEFSLLSRLSAMDNVPEAVKLSIPYVTPVARVIKGALNTLTDAFNMTKGVTKNTVLKLSRIGGKKQLFIQQKSAELADLMKRLKATGIEEASEKAYKILDSGAVKTATGYRSIRKTSPAEILKSVRFYIDGGKIDLPLAEFAEGTYKKNFLDTLNSSYRKAGGGRGTRANAFAIEEVGGSFRLKFTDKFDPEWFTKNFKKVIDADGMGLKSLDYGSVVLDDATMKLWNEHTDLIQDFSNLRNELSDILRKELGYYDMHEILQGRHGYMPHMITDEALKAKQSQLPAWRSKYATQKANMLRERGLQGTAEELTRFQKNFYDVDADLFDMNVQNGLQRQIEFVAETKEQHEVLQLLMTEADANGKSMIQIIDNTKESAAALGGDFKVLEGGFKGQFPKVFDSLDKRSKEVLESFFEKKGFGQANKAQAMNRTMFNYMKNIERAYVELPPFIKKYDKFINFWKSITLVTPGYHSKNFFGNMTNSYLAGMGLTDQLKYYPAAFRDRLKFNRVSKEIAQLRPRDIEKALGRARVNELLFKGIPVERVDMFDVEDLLKLGVNDVDARAYKRMYNYFESGSSQSHKGVRDLESVKLRSKKGGTLVDEVVRINYNLAEQADDWQRYALYRWQYDKTYKKGIKEGLNSVEAGIRASGDSATKVAEALFDYSHLTSFEKDYMKRLFPFYTFFKNNIGFQTKTLIKRPKQVARLGRTYNNYVTNIAGMEVDELPSYMAENMWLPIPLTVKKNDKEALAFLKTNLPVSDYAQFVEDPFREGANFITTPIKLLFEFGTGREVFTGLPLDRPIERAQTGVLKGIRDEKGNLTLPTSRLQKIAGDLGLRVPMNYLSVLLDLADTVTGEQDFGEGTADFMQRMGLVGVQEKERLRLTDLYQQLEKLRNRRTLYEAQTGQKLPKLEDIRPEDPGLPPGLDAYLRGLR